MRRLYEIVGLFFLISSELRADISYWDNSLVRSYVHYSDLQRRWAWSYLAPYLKEVQTDIRVLDIGCGDGKITADIAKFIPKGSILGIDPSNSMLNWARKQYHPIEYPNLFFKEGDFIELGIHDSFDLIVSFCALQHCSDQKEALNMISKTLKPNGKVLILVPAMSNKAWNQARATVQHAFKWAPHWQGYIPRKFLTGQQYEELLKEAGFCHVKVEHIQTMDPFVDQDEILDWLEGTFAPFVPKDLAREFYREWIEEYIRLDPQSMDEDGTIYAKLGCICIEASR